MYTSGMGGLPGALVRFGEQGRATDHRTNDKTYVEIIIGFLHYRHVYLYCRVAYIHWYVIKG